MSNDQFSSTKSDIVQNQVPVLQNKFCNIQSHFFLPQPAAGHRKGQWTL